MYAPPAAAANRRSGLAASGPLLAICCLGFILFLIAATIVLALIPVYLSTRGSTSSSNTKNYVMTMTPPGSGKRDSSSIPEGSIDSTTITNINNAVNSNMGFESGTTNGVSGTASTVPTSRRRRGFGLQRERRASIVKLFFIFFFNKHHCDKCGNKGWQNGVKPFIIRVFVNIYITGTNTLVFSDYVTFTCTIDFSGNTGGIPATSTAANTAKVIG
ncbi:unnamed protein product [Adineta steineri]|uniref:Uncharacterized protein n=1 Tax=Adineta steineri TaxID=433720 RepID=A0A813VBZ8_9BILA|nr:unnamed protein product [Adineta steineri]CAF4125526.1 unnamed protein product [Adineta steineri]